MLSTIALIWPGHWTVCSPDTAGQHLAGGHVDRQPAGDMVVVVEGDALAMQRASRRLVGHAGTDHLGLCLSSTSWAGCRHRGR